MKAGAFLGFLLVSTVLAADLEKARDLQDRAALRAAAAELSKAAQNNPNSASLQYRLALAESYLSQVAFELRDKAEAKTAAEAGVQAARRAVALQNDQAEYHRILGTLCGQVIPADVLAAFQYGRCAMDSIRKALELDPRSPDVYLSRGVGNYYLPAAFGGGAEPAIRDFKKAIELNPKSAEGYLWLGIALRRLNRNSEARAAITRSLELNPRRLWAKQQLEKTPAK